MFQLPADVPVSLQRAPVDFQLGINGLAATVEHAMQHDPLARTAYAFCNRRCNRIKLVGPE
jgi:transposase